MVLQYILNQSKRLSDGQIGSVNVRTTNQLQSLMYISYLKMFPYSEEQPTVVLIREHFLLV